MPRKETCSFRVVYADFNFWLLPLLLFGLAYLIQIALDRFFCLFLIWIWLFLGRLRRIWRNAVHYSFLVLLRFLGHHLRKVDDSIFFEFVCQHDNLFDFKYLFRFIGGVSEFCGRIVRRILRWKFRRGDSWFLRWCFFLRLTVLVSIG